AFKIISEGAVASGVRRIEAVTGVDALEYLDAKEALLNKAAEILKVTVEQLPDRVSNLMEEKKKLDRELVDLRRRLAAADTSTDNDKQSIMVEDISFIGRILEEVPARELKGLVDELKKDMVLGVVAVVSSDAKKASLVVGVTKDLEGRYNAIELVRRGVISLGGKGGGGRWDMAQAGGSDTQNASLALEEIKKALTG
ncbi:MAG: DHHA1 domain-containing protein, partial [Alphaproteobacteria bacterium]|nr:DHHA1 domain-containing protein [Alphaproteobacteria bacterium]